MSTVLSDPMGWFTLEIAEGWSHSTEDGVTTLQGPSGAGTLYLSGGRHAHGRQADFGGADFLGRFLEYLGVPFVEGSIETAQGVGCRIHSYRRQSEGIHWQYWTVTDDETVLLLSYTCPAPVAGLEAAEVAGMVESVRLFHSTPVH